ncbi:MAG: hypothetical protein VX265_05170 [Myxococcota bacterium]|nr:hypothetical protein [Myxococcota bacterium]
MAGPRDIRFWLRAAVAIGAVVMGLSTLLGGTVWFVLDDRGLAPPPRAAAEHVERVVRTHAPEPSGNTTETGPAKLRLHVVTAAGTPVRGMALALDPQTGAPPRRVTTDPTGMAAIDALPAGQRWVLRSEPAWLVQTPYSVRTTVEDAVQTVIVARTCAGPVRIRDQDGSPFVGRIRGMGGLHGQWEDLDETGTVHLARRPCGRIRVRVIDPRDQPERRTMWFDGEVSGHELVEFQIGPIRDAVVQLVDEEGAPTDATIRGATRLGIGRFRVEGRRDTFRFSVTQMERITQSFTVPLDGGIHERVVPRPRTVTVTLLCDACPDRLFCGTSIHAYGTCTGTSPDFTCTCPATESILASVSATALGSDRQGPHPLAVVEPAATHKTVEVRGGRAALEATWSGRVPCTAALAFRDVPTPMTADCGLDGTVFASDLFPGTWALTISDGFGVQAERVVRLESHETLDLGEIAAERPDSGW